MSATPVRAPDSAPHDDALLPFAVEPLDVRGRLVRLGPAIDAILRRHAYPAPVARLLAEAAALAALLGSSLKGGARFQLQARGDGAVSMLVVDYDAPASLRAYARFEAERLSTATEGAAPLGHGHLAFTIEPGGGLARYQGIVDLDEGGLEGAAHRYFERSEQIPSLVRLAAGEVVTHEGTSWRAGGLLTQFLPKSELRARVADLDPGDAPAGAARHAIAEDEAWSEAKALAGTVEDHELLDPSLSGERLLFRLFHERGVRVFAHETLRDACRCSDGRVVALLRGFPPADRAAMVGDDGMISVTCEFCGKLRRYAPSRFEAN
ncbi:MAG: Hsp33 family molecular chaperone [Hyphomicrobiales bacterium]|nr:Hsp33 family molecular chaperone [Hyphomicrobiales bacterium]MDE2017216.1 Hsp33 family molecular chaperone [Hyphomicrobiales bacterium]